MSLLVPSNVKSLVIRTVELQAYTPGGMVRPPMRPAPNSVAVGGPIPVMTVYADYIEPTAEVRNVGSTTAHEGPAGLTS